VPQVSQVRRPARIPLDQEPGIFVFSQLLTQQENLS